MTTHTMRLRREPFDLIRSGRKTVELRLYDEKRSLIGIGDSIRFTCEGETVDVRVTGLCRRDSFSELYEALGLGGEVYGVPADMEAYYTPAEQAHYGVLGIMIEVTDNG